MGTQLPEIATGAMATLNKLTVHLVSSQGSEEVTATSEAEGTSTEEWKILRTRHYDFFHVGPLSDEAAIASSLWELVKSDLRLPATTAEFYNGEKHPLSVSDQPADAMRKFTEGCRECKGLTGVCELTLIRRVATVANKNKDYKKRKARKLSAHFSGRVEAGTSSEPDSLLAPPQPPIDVPIPRVPPGGVVPPGNPIGLHSLFEAIISPAQVGPKAPATLKRPAVVLEGHVRAGKQKVKAGQKVATLVKKCRDAKGTNSELTKELGSCDYRCYGEWAGQDSDTGLSIPVKVCKMIVDLFKPTIEDGLEFWRAPNIGVSPYTVPCPPKQCACGFYPESQSYNPESGLEKCACAELQKCYCVLDTHVFHRDNSYVTEDLDVLVENHLMKHVPSLCLSEQYQIMESVGG
eukprot:gene13488-15945_t